MSDDDEVDARFPLDKSFKSKSKSLDYNLTPVKNVKLISDISSGTDSDKSAPLSTSSSEDELFYDAVEGSGTLISKYLSKIRTSRGDLTLMPGESYIQIPPPSQKNAHNFLVTSSSHHHSPDDKEDGQSSSLFSSNVAQNAADSLKSTLDSNIDTTDTIADSLKLSNISKSSDTTETEARLLKFEETKRRLEANDEEIETQSSSQTSSMDGLYIHRTSRPFKVIEQDSVSLSARTRPPDIISSCVAPPPPPPTTSTNLLTSTNTSTNVLTSPNTSSNALTSNSTNSHGLTSSNSHGLSSSSTNSHGLTSSSTNSNVLSSSSTNSNILSSSSTNVGSSSTNLVTRGRESSTGAYGEESSDKNGGDGSSAPVAPPRRKKRNKSPTISIMSNMMDRQGMSCGSFGFGVVTAQDEERTRSKCSGPRVLRRTESLDTDKKEVINTHNLPSSVSASEPIQKTTITNNPDGNFNVGNISGNGSNIGLLNETNLVRSPSGNLGGGEGKQRPTLYVRTKTDSGKMLSDMEILEQVTVVNLDTGERIPLSSAEDKIPKCINPLSLHIMRLTSEYVSEEKSVDSDDESKKSTASETLKRRGLQLKRFVSNVKSKALHKARSLKTTHRSVSEEGGGKEEGEGGGGEESGIKIKASPKHKGPYDFDTVQLVQDLSTEHSGPIWCMKFSNCGKLLATAGQDRLIRIWVLKSELNYFTDLIRSSKVSPTPSLESVPSPSDDGGSSPVRWPFVQLSSYSGHTADLLDIAWSKSFFLLSSSMDRTVRLWHISRRECLCCFQHVDFVTAIAFHPRDDRYFLSGSLDGKLRLWNIPDKKVALWNEVPGPNNLITTANFCQNGKFAVIGTYDGRCIFYHTEQLKYHTQIILNKKKLGKITGIEPMPGEDKILVTSNDSRIRLYDLRDLSCSCKYSGAVARSSQIKASFSHDGKFIISGSENSLFYIWRTAHEFAGFGGARRDRNSYWESVKAHNAVVTCAIFAPDPDLIIKEMDGGSGSTGSSSGNSGSGNYSPLGYVLASADFNGSIKVFICRVKPKCSSLPASAIA